MPRPRLYENDAARVAAFRARKNVLPLTVELPADLMAEFDEFLKFKDTTRKAVIEKLIRSQLLRKR
jgi:metal-responsive CopG/Arc/MetJ family transcriptional regulator